MATQGQRFLSVANDSTISEFNCLMMIKRCDDKAKSIATIVRFTLFLNAAENKST